MLTADFGYAALAKRGYYLTKSAFVKKGTASVIRKDNTAVADMAKNIVSSGKLSERLSVSSRVIFLSGTAMGLLLRSMSAICSIV